MKLIFFNSGITQIYNTYDKYSLYLWKIHIYNTVIEVINVIISIVGLSGSGKSHIAKTLEKYNPRILHIDIDKNIYLEEAKPIFHNTKIAVENTLIKIK